GLRPACPPGRGGGLLRCVCPGRCRKRQTGKSSSALLRRAWARGQGWKRSVPCSSEPACFTAWLFGCSVPWIVLPLRLPSAAKTGISNRMPIHVSSGALAVLCLTAQVGASTATGSFREWQVYGGDSAGAKYYVLAQLNRTN